MEQCSRAGCMSVIHCCVLRARCDSQVSTMLAITGSTAASNLNFASSFASLVSLSRLLVRLDGHLTPCSKQPGRGQRLQKWNRWGQLQLTGPLFVPPPWSSCPLPGGRAILSPCVFCPHRVTNAEQPVLISRATIYSLLDSSMNCFACRPAQRLYLCKIPSQFHLSGLRDVLPYQIG